MKRNVVTSWVGNFRWSVPLTGAGVALSLLVSPPAQAQQPTLSASQAAPRFYRPGGTLTVSNALDYSAGTLVSLQLRPILPNANWTILSVEGDGTPQLANGLITLAGTVPTNAMVYYTVQIPSGILGPQSIAGEVTYQFSTMSNPVTTGVDPTLHPNTIGGRCERDCNGDGFADMIVYCPQNGTWYFKHGTGSPTTMASGSSHTIHWGWNGATPMLGNYDGDNYMDYAVYDQNAGDWYIYLTTGSPVKIHWGWWEAQPVTGDFNGDGKTDLAVYHPASGTWYIKYSGTQDKQYANGATQAVRWGWSEAKPVAGDFDGDGTTDMAVYCARTGDWFIKFSSGGSTQVHFGWWDTIPVTGDFNGDGRTDLGVYCPTLGTWYIKYSGTNLASFAKGKEVSFQWGWKDALPAPADYDGDGVTDYAVYHKAAGDWYIRMSSTGQSTKVHWGWNQTDVVGRPQ